MACYLLLIPEVHCIDLNRGVKQNMIRCYEPINMAPDPEEQDEKSSVISIK